MTEATKVGFVGVGNIGRPMAMTLLRDGFDVRVYDDRADAVERCVADGAHSAGSLRQLAECAVVALAVSDDRAVTEVLEESGLLDALEPETVVLLHSTLLPTTAQRLAGLAARRGVHVLDAPVSGGAARAETGDLTVMVGGSAAGLERARGALESMAGHVVHIGDSGTAAAVKLANQLAMLASLAGTHEALRLTSAFGVSEETTLGVLGTSTGDSWVARNWGFFADLAREYDAASVDVAYRPWSKDLWDVVHTARLAGLTLPVSGLLAQVVADVVEKELKGEGRDG